MLYNDINDFRLNLKECKNLLDTYPQDYGNFESVLFEYIQEDFSKLKKDYYFLNRLKEDLLGKFLEYLIIAKSINTTENYEDYKVQKEFLEGKIIKQGMESDYKVLKAKSKYTEILDSTLINLVAEYIGGFYDKKTEDVFDGDFYVEDFTHEILYLYDEDLQPKFSRSIQITYKGFKIPLNILEISSKGKMFYHLNVKPINDVYVEMEMEDLFNIFDVDIENIKEISIKNIETLTKNKEVLMTKFKVSESSLNELLKAFEI